MWIRLAAMRIRPQPTGPNGLVLIIMIEQQKGLPPVGRRFELEGFHHSEQRLGGGITNFAGLFYANGQLLPRRAPIPLHV
jgi:hypothetical protein